MIIEGSVAPYVMLAEDSLLAALGKISANRARIIFLVNERGQLQGSLSDGDFRRWLLANPDADLNSAALVAANPNPVTARTGAAAATLEPLFRAGRDKIPLLDELGRLQAIASATRPPMVIGRHTIGEGNPALVIAEIGNNHQGDVKLAKHLVDLAADSGADIVKFQLRDLDSLYRKSGANLTDGEDLGPQYTLNLLAKFNLPAEKMIEVLDHCKQVGIEAICTPWDLPSLEVLVDYGPPALKIASADLTNHELLAAASASHLPLVVSTGMATEAEIADSVRLLHSQGAQFALLQCQSTYPAPYKDVNLRYMDRLAEIGDCPVGYSGHERGYHVPLAAVARGAAIIEKHFTVDRGLEGNDHKVSLLPDEFASMVAEIRDLESALGSAAPREVSTGELMNRANLAKSLVAARRIVVGEVIGGSDVLVKSPGRGLQPNHRGELVGRTARRTIEAGDFFYTGDLTDDPITARRYAFRRPWGLPVRYHDTFTLLPESNPDFLEFHLSYKDVEVDYHEVFDGKKLPIGYAVHTPDLYAGDFMIDLASQDDRTWQRSIVELGKVLDIARGLRPYFTPELDPVVIVTVGGFLRDRFATVEERDAMYARVAEALKRVDQSGVRLTPQTMPPFPWLMGGQQHHNLFMTPEDTVAFCETYGYQVTLDVSHSKLAANWARRPFSEFVELMAPHTAHLHVVDAHGVDGEGDQVGDGEVDFAVLAEQCDRLCPQAGFIPEIWQGHVNNGEGFWVALDRLETWF